MDTSEYIDLAKKNQNIGSDYQLSKRLGIDRSAIANYRKKRRNMDDFVAIQIAHMIDGCDPLEIIISANLAREKDIDKKDWWLDQYKMLSERGLGIS